MAVRNGTVLWRRLAAVVTEIPALRIVLPQLNEPESHLFVHLLPPVHHALIDRQSKGEEKKPNSRRTAAAVHCSAMKKISN